MPLTPDIVAVGFQELISQSLGAILPLGGSCHGDADAATKHAAGRLEYLDFWLKLVLAELNATYGSDDDENGSTYYEPIHIQRMIALGLMVFVKKGDHARAVVREVWEGDVGTGLLGKYPNKGCVAAGLDLDVIDDTPEVPDDGGGGGGIPAFQTVRRTSVCFANAHLGPHEGHDYFLWRNDEVRHILNTLTLQSTREPTVRALDDFAALFFFGDLNYRLMGAGTPDSLARSEYRRTILTHIEARRHEPILDMDELIHLRETMRFAPLAGWLEPAIRFLPSYKFRIPQSSLTSAEKVVLLAEQHFASNRVPAYCDRIMYRAVDFDRAEHGDTDPTRPRAAGWISRGSDDDDDDSAADEKRPKSTAQKSDEEEEEEEEEEPPAPSWTAAREFTAAGISPLAYSCAHEVTWSDHKPVAAVFALRIDYLASETSDDRVMTTEDQDALVGWARAKQSERFWEITSANLYVRCGMAVLFGFAAVAAVAWAGWWDGRFQLKGAGRRT
ncbi:hypothetical protein HDU87_008273 [Geranomyces variabilis]|uniref:Inositol polyphosphate-related phosphatase domain-containing protein n=1 Tax=Geranomyces variabilis TaxID=109894 RepID=A0AAD5TEA1_9FUNG|nr:hypothetical protein HDU87_008273 [Geranomyces variabilis]